jgi:hypothetical protein
MKIWVYLIKEYIKGNPLKWELDSLHPKNSKQFVAETSSCHKTPRQTSPANPRHALGNPTALGLQEGS